MGRDNKSCSHTKATNFVPFQGSQWRESGGNRWFNFPILPSLLLDVTKKKWRNSTRTKVKFSFKMVDYKTIDEQFQHMIDKSIFFSVPLICNLICFLSFYQNLNRVLIGRLRKVELKCKSRLRLCFNFWFFFSSLSLFFGWSGVTILSQIQFCRQSHREASDTAIIIKSDFAAANSDGDHLRFLQFSKTYVYPPNKIPQFLAQQSQQKKPSVSYEILSNSNMKQNFFTSSKKKKS